MPQTPVPQQRLQAGSDSDDSDDTTPTNAQYTSRWQAAVVTLVSWASQLVIYTRLNLTDVRQRKVAYALGLGSCTLVVLFAGIFLSVQARLPVMFLRLGELNKGEADLILSPGGQAADADGLNYTAIAEAVAPAAHEVKRPVVDFSYHAPRMVLEDVTAVNPLQCTAPFSGGLYSAVWWLGSSSCVIDACIESVCPTRAQHDVTWAWIDSEKEAEMNYGRSWRGGNSTSTHPSEPIPPGHVAISSYLARVMGVGVGDAIALSGDLANGLTQPLVDAGLESAGFVAVFNVSKIFSDSESTGKFGSGQSSLIMSEFNTSLAHLAKFVSPFLSSASVRTIAAGDPYEFATLVSMNVPTSQRADMYSGSYDKVLRKFNSFFSRPLVYVGPNQLKVSAPLVDYLESTEFFSLFVGLLMNLVIVCLAGLSVFLIYALLNVGLQMRQYDLGVMRMVGMTTHDLAMYVLVGAGLFAVPAVALGLTLAQLGFLAVRGVVASILDVDVSPLLVPSSIGYGVLAGLVIPLGATIAPIYDVLTQSLAEALDTARGRTQVLSFNISRADDLRLQPAPIIFGAVLFVCSFLVYYLFPVALYTSAMSMLFAIFLGVLLAMLFGLVLLAVNFEHLVQTFILYTVAWAWERASVFRLANANALAHRQRNRKISIMFACSMAFIVFLTVSFSLAIDSFSMADRRSFGATIVLNPSKKYLTIDNVRTIDAQLKLIAETFNGTFTSTWMTRSMSAYSDVTEASTRTVGGYKADGATVMAVSPNYFTVATREFYRLGAQSIEATANGKTGYTPAEALYTYTGSYGALVGTSLGTSYEVSTHPSIPPTVVGSDMFVVRTGIEDNASNTVKHNTLKRVVALFDSAAGVSFSKYPSTSSDQPVVMSAVAACLLADHLQSLEELQFAHVYVDVKSGRVGDLANALDFALLGEPITVNQFDTGSTDMASSVIDLFFILTEVLALVICFFALVATMGTNISEQTKDIGILRSLGMTRAPITRIFVLEAFAVIFAACCLGTAIGAIVSLTIVSQNSMFTQLPLPFKFPWPNVGLMAGCAVGFSILSTVGPLAPLLKTRSITGVLKKVA
jgi:ABC-type antimicrobial peptide transport system permease subunit